MTTLLLTIHVLAAIFGFGVVLAFPFMGAAAEKDLKGSALIMTKLNHVIEKGVVLPAAGIQLVTGILLILNLHIDLTKNVWLGASILLFLAALGLATGAMLPRAEKLIALLSSGDDASIGAKAPAMLVTQRTLGMITTLMLVVITGLMVWRPGQG